MTDAFKRKLAQAWGKRALTETANMLAQGHAKGFGDALTPVGKPKVKPGFDPAAYDPENKTTWPCDLDSGKGAFLSDWQHRRLTPQEIARYDREGNGLGVVCRADPADGTCVAWIDCDITEHGPSSYAMTALQTGLAALGITQFPVRRRGSHSWLVAVLITDGVPAYEQRHTKRGGYSLERGGVGHQFVAGGPHACGAWRYWTRHGQTTETPLAEMPAHDELPKLTLAQFYELFEAVAAVCEATKGKAKGGSGGAPAPSGSGFKLLPKADPTHHALPDDRKSVFLAVLAALPNEKGRKPWIGCASVLIGAMRQWPEGEARAVWQDWCAKYGGDPDKDEDLFKEKWAERGRLPVGWPEFVQWAKRDLGGYHALHELGVTDEDMALCSPAGGESRAAADFAAALQALREAQTEPGQVPAQAKKRRIIDLAKPAGLPRKPPAVTDWHTRGVLGVLASAPGVGKTTFACLTALAIAHERPNLVGSFRMDWGGAVVLVLNETDEATARATLIAAETHFGLKHADRKHPIIIWPEPLKLMFKGNKGAPVPTPEATAFVADLAELRGDYPLALIVIDTLASALLGLNENDAPDAQAFASMLNEIGRAGYYAVQALHHNRKPSSDKEATAADVRGSTALIGAARCVLTLSPASSAESSRFQEGETLRLNCVKRNDAPQTAPVFLARTEELVAVEDPRSPSVMEHHGYAVLHPATPVPAFRARADIYATYTALEAAQAAGIELRDAGQAMGKG